MLVSGLHCIFSAPISSPASNEVDTDEHANCSITDQDSSHCNACAGSKPASFTLSPQDFPLNNSTDMEDEMRQAFSGSARLIKASRQVYNQWVSHNMSFLLIPSVTRIPQCIFESTYQNLLQQSARIEYCHLQPIYYGDFWASKNTFSGEVHIYN